MCFEIMPTPQLMDEPKQLVASAPALAITSPTNTVKLMVDEHPWGCLKTCVLRQPLQYKADIVNLRA